MTSNTKRWLTLTEASEQLGIHPTTLRRWADNGDLPVYITPGGHRRFLQDDIAAFMKNRSLMPQADPRQILEVYLLGETRQRLRKESHPAKLDLFTEQQRTEQRELGQRMISLIMQHMTSAEGDDELLQEARRSATLYGKACRENGLTVADSLEIVMFFRDNLSEVALHMPQMAQMDENEQVRVLRKINQVFNTIQLGLLAYFQT